MATSLILKRAPIGPNLEDYSVLEGGIVVSRIFLSPGAPQGRLAFGRAATTAR